MEDLERLLAEPEKEPTHTVTFGQQAHEDLNTLCGYYGVSRRRMTEALFKREADRLRTTTVSQA